MSVIFKCWPLVWSEHDERGVVIQVAESSLAGIDGVWTGGSISPVATDQRGVNLARQRSWIDLYEFVDRIIRDGVFVRVYRL
jgi:hypothetical protein